MALNFGVKTMFKKIIQFIMGQATGYVSPADRFLAELRRRNPTLSPSQQQEVQQSLQLSALRDGQPSSKAEPDLWREF
jgi:hypothetical protein